MIKGKFAPSPGYVLISPHEEDNSTVLIARVNSASEPLKIGKVLSVGEMYTTEFNALIKCPVKVGDTIVHQTIGYEEIEIEHKKYRVVPFTKIIGVWHDEDKGNKSN